MTALDQRPAAAPSEPIATQLYLSGHWQNASNGGTFTDLNPTTAQPLTTVASATVAAVHAAVVAAWAQQHGE